MRKRKQTYQEACKSIPERRVKETDLLEPLKTYFHNPEDSIGLVRSLT